MPIIEVARNLETIRTLLLHQVEQSSTARVGRLPLDALLLCSLMLSTAAPSQDRAWRSGLAAVIEAYRQYRPLPPYLYPEASSASGKQVIAYAETEAGARRIASASGVDTSIHKTPVLASLYPQGHPAYSPREEIRWAVLVPEGVSVSSVRERISPEAKVSSFIQYVVSWYDAKMSRQEPVAESGVSQQRSSDQTPAGEPKDREERHD